MSNSREKTILRTPQSNATEAIIGNDDRNQVDPSRLHWDPYTGILRMEMSFSSNGSIGTAWLVSDRVALTAGHNFISDSGEAASQVILQQAHSGDRVHATAYFVNERYRNHQTEGDDYALVELERPFHDAAHIGYGVYTDSEIRGRRLTVIGFPEDKPARSIWHHSGQLTDLTSRHLRYQIDTVGGQSGAPVLDVVRVNGKQRFVSTAIHQGYKGHINGIEQNQAVRIDDEIFHKIDQWRNDVG